MKFKVFCLVFLRNKSYNLALFPLCQYNQIMGWVSELQGINLGLYYTYCYRISDGLIGVCRINNA